MKKIAAVLISVLIAFYGLGALGEEAYRADYKTLSPMVFEGIEQEWIDVAYRVVDAFLRGEKSVYVDTDQDRFMFMNDVGYVINCLCPPFDAFTDFNSVASFNPETKMIFWEYTLGPEEVKNAITAFEEKVNGYLSLISPSDSEVMRAMVLYLALIEDAVYDYGLLGDAYDNMPRDEFGYRESSFCAIMDGSGICSSYALALNYLYTQSDIVSVTVSHSGGAVPHAWLVAQLDGEYYYFDPTWDVSDAPSNFGVTAKHKEIYGGYSADGGSFLQINIPETYHVDDERFLGFLERLPVEITDVVIDKEAQEIIFYNDSYACVLECLKEGK